MQVWQHSHGVWENTNVKVFDTPWHLVHQKVLIISLECTPESHKLYCAWPFNVSNNHTTLNLQKTRIQNTEYAVYIFHTWPWTKVKFIKPRIIMETPSKLTSMQSLKYFASIVSDKKPALKDFEMRKYVNELPWKCAIVRNDGLFMFYLTYLKSYEVSN